MRNFFIISLLSSRLSLFYIALLMEDEEIMCIALLKAKSLNTLNQIDLKALSSLFNLSSKNSFENGLLQLKKTISYIILIERNDIREYLSLSKFRRLPSSLYNQLFTYCSQLWELFCAEKIAIDKSNLKIFQQIRTPMQKLAKSLTEVKLNEEKDPSSQLNFDRFNSFYPQFGASSEERGLNYHNNQPMPSYLFPYQNYMGGVNSVGNVGNGLFQNFNNSRGNMFDTNVVLQNRQPSKPFNSEIITVKNPSIVKDKNSKEFQHVKGTENKAQGIEEESQNFLFGFKQEEVSDKQCKGNKEEKDGKDDKEMQSEEGAIESLKGCYCGQGSDSTLIKCQLCSKQFHFKCWQSQIKIDAICPFCRVEKQHVYTKLVGDPIFERCSLTDQQFFRSKKIMINEEEAKTLTEAIQQIESNTDKIWAELRVLKISKQQEERRRGRNAFIMPLSDLRRLLERKWLELNFKNISEGDCIIFVLVCTTPKELPVVQKEIQALNKGEENVNFMRDWMAGKGLQTYNISAMHPITKNRIIWPVRGDRCDHIQCEDLPVIYDQGTKREGKIVCSYCHEAYSVYEPFHFDPTLLRIMKRNISQSEIKIDMSALDERMGPESSQQRSQK